MIRPHHAKPDGGTQHSPQKSFRETRPARPAGGGTNDFRFSSVGVPAPLRYPELSVPGSRGGDSPNYRYTPPARHSCGNYRSPTRASRRQTIPAKLHTCSRHKRQTLSTSQTPRFNLPTSAHFGVFAPFPIPRKKRHFPPRPSPQSGRADTRIPGEPRSPAPPRATKR